MLISPQVGIASKSLKFVITAKLAALLNFYPVWEFFNFVMVNCGSDPDYEATGLGFQSG